MRDVFNNLAAAMAHAVGTYWAFLTAVLVIVVWGVTGPIFGYSDTWQLLINTGTTIVTFLMVFLIQNTQNRDARAMHLKLDEVIRASKNAHNGMIDIEDLNDEQLDKLADQFRRLREEVEEDDTQETREIAARTAKEVSEKTVQEKVGSRQQAAGSRG